MTDTDSKLAELLRDLASEMRALKNEMRAMRERKVSTRRVKATKNAQRLNNVPVDDIAAAAARRAMAKFGG